MIFGLFSINPIITAIFILLSILALIGMSTNKFKNKFNDTYESILKRYKKRVLFFIQKKWLSMGLVVASCLLYTSCCLAALGLTAIQAQSFNEWKDPEVNSVNRSAMRCV